MGKDQGKRSIYLKGQGQLRVACYFDDDMWKVANQFEKGRSVRVIGKFDPIAHVATLDQEFTATQLRARLINTRGGLHCLRLNERL